MEFTKISSCGSNNNGVKLLDAATEGRADDAVELLAQDPILILFADAMGDTAFHIAARAGHGSTVLKMIEFLKLGHIELLEEVLWESNAHRDMPLHLALENGHKDLAFDLVSTAGRNYEMMIFRRNDDDKDACDLAKEAGIHLSCERRRVEKESIYPVLFVDRLVLDEHSAEYTSKCPMDIPCGAGSIDILMGLTTKSIRNENDGNNDDDEEFIKLFKAAETNEEDVVKEILEKNPNTLACKIPMGWTALHMAASKGNMGPLKKMVEFMKNNNSERLLLERDNKGNVPLHFAIEGGHEKVARYLVEMAPRAVCIENQSRESPLLLATDKKYSELIRYMTRPELFQSFRNGLLEHAEKINIGHRALKKRNLATFEAILKGLPDLINVRDKKGWTLLSYAASKGYFEELSYILKHFPDSARERDGDGSFPIHKAVAGGCISVVKELLLHCPQALQHLDGKDRNPLDIADKYKRNDVLSYLKEIDK